MYEYLITFILAFIISFSATPIARKLAFRIGAIDIPKDGRRMHNKPIALMGGAAVITGFIIAVIFDSISNSRILTQDNLLLSLLAGIAIITIMGVIDDVKKLSSWWKLAFQIAAAITVVVLAGTRISIITNPFSHSGYTIISPYISYPITVLWIVGVTNALNLIDGLDGLAAGVATISSLSLFFVSVLRIGTDPLAIYTAVITAALAGSSLGFLPFNFNPAKIFMGETGAAFLGFTLGVISIQGTLKSYAAISISIPILVLGLPLFDTLFAILRRVFKGKSPMVADRSHLHHKLIDMGLSQRQSVIILYTASAALGLCAIVLADRGAMSAIILLIAVAVFVIGGARYMSDISSDRRDENVSKAEEDTAAASSVESLPVIRKTKGAAK